MMMKGCRRRCTEFMLVLALVLTIVSSLLISTLGKDEEEGKKGIGNEWAKDQLLHTVLSRKLSHHHHHKAFFPLVKSDVVGFILASAGLIISAGGGIGGGGMLVPIYILVMKFHTKMAIPLSNITVLGGAMANILLNMKKRHPLADRPRVDWDLILMMEPLTIGGALIGALVNKVIPEEILTILMVVLLGYISWRTISKGIEAYKIEAVTKDLAVEIETDRNGMLKGSTLKSPTKPYGSMSDIDSVSESAFPLLTEREPSIVELPSIHNDRSLMGDYFPSPKDMYENGEQPQNYLPEKQQETGRRGHTLKIIMDEERSIPLGKVGILLVIFFVVLVINVLKGGGNTKSLIGIRCGSFAFWLSNFLALAWLSTVTKLYGNYLLMRWRLKEKVGYRYVEGDVEWDGEATVKYPCVCGFAGFFAGLFGIGGGIVKGPMMLEMGVLPSVASATCSTMIFFTSFTAATSFIMFGLLPFDYGAFLFVLGFVSTFVGQLGMNYLIKKLNSQNIIILSVGAAVFISAIMMAGKGLYTHIMSEGNAAQTNSLSIC